MTTSTAQGLRVPRKFSSVSFCPKDVDPRGFAAQAKVQAQIDELEESLRIREGQIGELELRIPIRREEASSLREDIADLDRVVRDLYARMTRERATYNDWLGSQPSLRGKQPLADR